METVTSAVTTSSNLAVQSFLNGVLLYLPSSPPSLCSVDLELRVHS